MAKPKQEDDPNLQRLTANIPTDLHRRFRLEAVKRGVPIRTVLTEAVALWLNKNENSGDKKKGQG
jgi:hypothetical protein